MKLRFNIIKSGIEYNIRTPMSRMGKPDEIARMSLVLVSDLSSYINGSLIVVDRGFLPSETASSQTLRFITQLLDPIIQEVNLTCSNMKACQQSPQPQHRSSGRRTRGADYC